MTKFLTLGGMLTAVVLASGCVSYSRTTRTEPVPAAAIVTPVPPGTAVVAPPATTTTVTTIR